MTNGSWRGRIHGVFGYWENALENVFAWDKLVLLFLHLQLTLYDNRCLLDLQQLEDGASACCAVCNKQFLVGRIRGRR